jgi:hypothetical protein
MNLYENKIKKMRLNYDNSNAFLVFLTIFFKNQHQFADT